MLYHRTWFPEPIPFCSDKTSADYKHPCFSGVPWRSTSLATWGHHKAKQDLLLCGEGEYKHLANDMHNCVTFLATTSQRLPDTCSQGSSFKGGESKTIARFLIPAMIELTLFLGSENLIYKCTHVTLSFLDLYLVATKSMSNELCYSRDAQALEVQGQTHRSKPRGNDSGSF